MPTLDQLRCFKRTVETRSFSAAARSMSRAQSAVSTAIANLEIDLGVELFDRSGRSPVLTEAGRSLLPHAEAVLLGHRELTAMAQSLHDGVETRLGLAVERGLERGELLDLLAEFGAEFPHVALTVLTPGPDDAGALLRSGRVQLGLMVERESYPAGFRFQGVGHGRLLPVCAADHALARLETVDYKALRAHRQVLLRSRREDSVAGSEQLSPSTWQTEDPRLAAALVARGLCWGELPREAVAEGLETGLLIRLRPVFQSSDQLEGIDVVWTERVALGPAGQWLRRRLVALSETLWKL